MVLVSDLKQDIEQGSIPDFLIFVYVDSGRIIARQYIEEIAKRSGKGIQWVDDVEDMRTSTFFDVEDFKNIPIYECDELKCNPENLRGYIICKKIGKGVDTTHVCELPGLEEWQLKDYLFSICEGASTQDLEQLFFLLKNNPERLMVEAERLSVFPPIEREFVLKEMFQSNFFSDLSNDTIYTLSNALCVGDIATTMRVLRQIESIDIEPVGLVTIMINNFRNMLLIQGHPNPTPEKTCLPAKQFYAISRNLGYYSISQMMYILKELDAIDFKLKTGELPADYIIPYIVTMLLSTKVSC